MNNEFKKSKSNNETRYTLESMTAGATGAGSVATSVGSVGKVQKRGNILAQEAGKDKVDASKPRNFVAKNAKTGGAGAHKDKKKEQKQGVEKHKKPYMEALKQKIEDLKSKLNEAQGVAEGERTMSRAAKGHEKYGKAGMAALAKAGRDGAGEKKLDAIRDKHDNYNEDNDPCWSSHKQVGTKKKGGKTVPNCVPKESVDEVAGAQKCWPGHRKTGTQAGTGKNAGKRVNNCEKIKEDDIEESGLQYHTGVKKHGKEYMVKAAAAGRDGASQKELGALKDKYSKAYKEDSVAGGSGSNKTELAMAYLKAIVMAPTGTPDKRRILNWQQMLSNQFDIEMDTATLAQMLPQFDSMLQAGKLDKLQNRMASRGELEIGERQQGVAEGEEDRTSYQVAKILADRGMTYDPAQENELINAIGMVLVKELSMTPKQARYLISYDEDFVADTMGELRSMEQSVPEAAKKGLYYYVNKRKKAGTSRDADSPKAPTDQAWKDAAKTAKKEGADPYMESLAHKLDQVKKK